MSTALGLLGLVAFIAGVIAAAAAVTWTVVKLTPTRDDKEKEASAA